MDMLDTYAKEIEVLSRKRIERNLANQTIEKIKTELPKSAKSRHELLRRAVSSLLNSIKKKDYDDSFGLLRFIFFTEFESPLLEARKQGVFRASKFAFNSKLINELIVELYASDTLSSDGQEYLKSVSGLIKASPDIHHLKEMIISAAKSRPYFLKTVLAIAETKFCDLLEHPDERLEKPYVDLLFYKNKESILTAASYLVQVYRENDLPIKISNFNYIDERIDHQFYLDLFKSAFAIINYLESEIKVDFYDYKVWVDPEKKLISIDNVEFEEAKSYGYVRTKLRFQSLAQHYEKKINSKSYQDFLEEIWNRDSLEEESLFYEVKKTYVEMIELKLLPMEIYAHEINSLSHDGIFKEEEFQIYSLMNEYYNNKFQSVEIYRGFCFIDFLKIQRLFWFIGFVYNKAYKHLKDAGCQDAEKIRKRSVLVVLEKEEFVKLLNKATGKPLLDCEALLKKLSISEPQIDEVIDLQYNPILAIENSYLVMPTVLAFSNLWRSLAISEKVHLSVCEGRDYMVTAVAGSLKLQGFKVRQDFNFGKDEVDIAAVMDGNLFLFECKNPYHPVNDFELRNTYAHLVKGFDQLSKFRRRFENSQELDQFLKNLNLNIGLESIKYIHYGVINANRALSGFSKAGVRVFHANELMNFVTSGEIISGRNKYSCWKTDAFNVHDFIAYINAEILINDMVSKKTLMPFSFKLRSYRLLFKTFQYDLEKTSLLQKHKYRYIGPAY